MITAKPSSLLAKLLKRRNFTGLMELYEINYRLLNKLIADFTALQGSLVSRVNGSPDLHLHVEERSRFTTTLALTYHFETGDGGIVADPDLHIRIYHDARLAEAMSCQRQGREGGWALASGHARKRSDVDCRWESNLFLEKWLAYTLTQGHRFGSRAEDAAETAASRAPLATS
ncbi:MAG: DUF1249 domain-containing protein [Gammaproteobacteria bacterium]